jgi:hypothetical protein
MTRREDAATATRALRRGAQPRSVYAGLVLAFVAAGSGCYPQAQPQLAKLRIVAEPKTTTVYVDDQYIGSARVLATQPKSLRPGVKFITFKAPDYFPHDVRMDLPPGETTIEMKLRKIPQ